MHESTVDVCLAILKHIPFYATRFSQEHLITTYMYSSLKCFDAKFTAKHALYPVVDLTMLFFVVYSDSPTY